mgnify:CR=1 FL=1
MMEEWNDGVVKKRPHINVRSFKDIIFPFC